MKPAEGTRKRVCGFADALKNKPVAENPPA